MQIGQVAKETGLEASAIRFYEQQGVIPPAKRTSTGYRNFDASDIDLIRFVKRARSLSIPIEDIRQIVTLRNEGEAPCGVVRAVISREAASIKKRIADLQELEKELLRLEHLAKAVSDDWPGGACVCHIVESPN